MGRQDPRAESEDSEDVRVLQQLSRRARGHGREAHAQAARATRARGGRADRFAVTYACMTVRAHGDRRSPWPCQRPRPCERRPPLPPANRPGRGASMQSYSLTHLTDAVLLRDLSAIAARDRVMTATLLAHIAEVDARRLFVPAGHPSMHAFCVEHLRYSDDAAFRRIRAARAARRFPALFSALADGRLHLSAVSLLAAHLTVDNVDTLIDAATHRRKTEIEEWLAERFLA